MRLPIVDCRLSIGPARVTLLLLIFCCPLRAENIVETSGGATTRPVRITDADVEAVLRAGPWPRRADIPKEHEWVKRLDQHVNQFLDGYPWKPFHCTLGISGHETHFDHPDRLFLSLVPAASCLESKTAERIWELLEKELNTHPPYALQGFEPDKGGNRESYDLPDSLRARKASQARSALGVYALWLCAAVDDPSRGLEPGEIARKHLPAIEARMARLIEENYTFDPAKTTYTGDEAQKLNGDIAGLIGYINLTRPKRPLARPQVRGDRAAQEMTPAEARLKQLLELRINLERINPNILEKTHGASKSLHNHKLARYCDLTPELALALLRHTDGLAARRLREFRAERNGWYMAFGERMIGGENYISPPHMAHAMFLGAAWIEQLEPGTMAQFIDVPWCKGDLYYIEKLAVALRGLPKQ